VIFLCYTKSKDGSDTVENTDKSASADAPIAQPRDMWWVRFVGYIKRKIDERTAKKQKEPPVDRAARVTANATLWIAIFTFVSVAVSVGTFLILKSQLKEMHDGGVDTHNLAQAAMDSADLTRKQMEGVSAAIVQMRNGSFPDVSVGAPPWGGQIRFGFTNVGHVIAHHVHVKFTATLHEVANPKSESKLVSAEDEILALSPASANINTPDLMFEFRTNPKPVVDTYKEFIIVKGSFSYENGFDKTVRQDFCQGYIWGPGPKIGRLYPRCGTELVDALKALREANHPNQKPN
jgi:hypothetical protein